MGSAISTPVPDNPIDQETDSWTKLENQTYTLDLPNINEILRDSEIVLSSSSNNQQLKIICNNNKNNNTSNVNGMEENSSSMDDVDDDDDDNDNDGGSDRKSSNCLEILELKNVCTATEIATELSSSIKREQSLEEFKEDLRQKRLARQTAISDLRNEVIQLRKQLAAQRQLTSYLSSNNTCNKNEIQNNDIELIKNNNCAIPTILDVDAAAAVPLTRIKNENVSSVVDDYNQNDDNDDDDDLNVSCQIRKNNHKLNGELAEVQLALQLANADNLSLSTELGVIRKQVSSLKEVIVCCKQMIQVKEEQANQLKSKLREIEISLADRELRLMSDNLRKEYDRQLENIRTLRQLYEDRQRVTAAEHENLQRQIGIKKDELDAEMEKTRMLEERAATLEKELELANNELKTLKEQCNEYKFENKELKEEMGVVNKLFSQMLMGFNGTNNLDIDRLTTMLEENRILLNEMATKESHSDGARLPKLLFDLVEQAGNFNRNSNDNDDDDNNNNPNIVQECTSSLLLASGRSDGNSGGTSASGRNESETKLESSLNVSNASSKILSVKNNRSLEETTTKIEEVKVNHEKPLNNLNTNVTRTTNDGGNNVDFDVDDCNNNDENDGDAVSRKVLADSVIVQQNLNETDNNNGKTSSSSVDYQPEIIGKVASAEEIIGNLPKVWRVLMELLSHHKMERVQFKENGQSEDCYKSVETPNGPKAELSVSKTYIKLKDLILEKKSLQKETSRLKTLNSHLEYRLDDQQKRLSTVCLELNKTWHLVGKMQRQHRQLHTHEQILRYQLQQKRRMLTELKDELEYCRRKWAAARAKNDESQLQCDDLRKEFARRKLEDANNSGESGYSDGPGSDEDDTAQNVGKKNWPEVFEHKNVIERMQSTSPTRDLMEIPPVRRNSAPPSIEDIRHELDGAIGSKSSGAIPKNTKLKQHEKNFTKPDNYDELSDDERRKDRSTRIQRLEDQCKSLIAQVIETSGNREQLEIQLCHFQDEISPVQHAIPLEEYISKKYEERLKSFSPEDISVTLKKDEDCLTDKEREYTRKRGERLGRLEEESRELIARIKRTNDRANNIRSSVERVHTRCMSSREGSFDTEENEKVENNGAERLTRLEEENNQILSRERCQNRRTESREGSADSNMDEIPVKLTVDEETYLARRSERLKRLEEESKTLLSKLSKNSERGTCMNNKLDQLHEKYGSEPREIEESACGEPQADVNQKENDANINERLVNASKISINRDERLKIMEEESRALLTKLNNTSSRGSRLIEHLDEREQIKSINAAQLELKSDNIIQTSAEHNILPTLKNVASSSIVSEEATNNFVITQTPSQIAQSTGAIPKQKIPTGVQLCRSKRCEKQTKKIETNTDSKTETIEEMFMRLSQLPFSNDDASTNQSAQTGSNGKSNNNSDGSDNSNKNSNNDESPSD